MAQKKDTPASMQPKENRKKTSRRTFGKQLTGALAALPVASMITTPGASALASGISDTKRRVFKPPANGVWNGPERFQAIAPAIGVVTSALSTLEGEEEYAPVEVAAAALSASVQSQINDAISNAAKGSGATEDQIRNWIDAFLSLGKGGLMAEIPLLAADCAANMNGTWELTSRFSGGVETAARGQMYFDMDPTTASGKSLITLTTEVNFFEGTTSSIFFIGLADVHFTQNGPYEVIGNSSGTTFGNVQGYENGVKTTDVFRLVRRGQNETMVGRPTRTESNGSDTAARTLVEVGGDPGTIKYKMWGALATANHPRTMDTVDTYAIMSNLPPLVGGWEPISDYFDRVTKQGLFKTAVPLTTLQRASKAVSIPRGSRH